MSMVNCTRCDRYIDSDDDPDCFVDDPRHSLKGNVEIILCEPCRDKAADEAERAA